MLIKRLILKDWRNISATDIRLDAAGNIFIGRNAQGKTNILEAINYATILRGRAERMSELIRFGEDVALMRLEYVKAGVEHELAIETTRERRRIMLDGKPLQPRELIGRFNSVLFTPEDLLMVKGSPSVRRRFLDAQFSQVMPEYFAELLRYKKLVTIRNALLKKIREGSAQANELDLWDEELGGLGNRLVRKRLAALLRVQYYSKEAHRALTAGAENLEIEYVCSAEDLKAALRARRLKDIQQGSTGAGVHHDDLRFLINGREAKIYGSQGQIRTVALSLKLAELEFLKTAGEYPPLLLDDVASELDAARREQLIKILRRERIQTLITTTDRENFPAFVAGATFIVKAGAVNELRRITT